MPPSRPKITIQYYKVRLAQQYSQSGHYYDAADLLDQIDPAKLSEYQKLYYFRAMCNVQNEIAGQTKNESLRTKALDLSRVYRDSILHTKNYKSDIFLQMLEEQLRGNKEYEKSLAINDQRLERYYRPLRRYAIVASCRYQTYKQMDAPLDEQLYWLAESAIYDVRYAIMNQSSLWELADILSRKGDLNRSYKYISFSWDCATRFRSQARTKQISPILNTINLKYQEKIQDFSSRLKIGMWLLVLLILLLLVLLYYFYREHKKLKFAKQEIDNKNEDLSRAVQALDESNHKKERYIGAPAKPSVCNMI